MKTTKWRIQEYLKTPKDVAYYLQSALKDSELAKDSFIRIVISDSIKALKNINKQKDGK